MESDAGYVVARQRERLSGLCGIDSMGLHDLQMIE